MKKWILAFTAVMILNVIAGGIFGMGVLSPTYLYGGFVGMIIATIVNYED